MSSSRACTAPRSASGLERGTGELGDIGADGRAAVEEEAAGLTRWFAGTRVLPRFPSPLAPPNR